MLKDDARKDPGGKGPKNNSAMKLAGIFAWCGKISDGDIHGGKDAATWKWGRAEGPNKRKMGKKKKKKKTGGEFKGKPSGGCTNSKSQLGDKKFPSKKNGEMSGGTVREHSTTVG